MSKVFVALILLCSSSALASGLTLEQWQRLAVKIRSYPCQSKKPQFEGSGLLVRQEKSLQVVTTDHVIISQADTELCHEVSNPQVGKIKMQLQRYDYLKGMAVLESPLVSGLNIPIATLDANAMDGQRRVLALGFPAGTDDLHVLQNGLFVALDRRSLIPQISGMYEMGQLPVEFGMSGGFALNPIGDDLYEYGGMLTHQFLKRQAGDKSVPQMLSSKSGLASSDLTLSIPNYAVEEWFRSQDISAEDLWGRKLNSDHKVYTTYGPLIFEKQAIKSDEVPEPGNDGSGIGGEGGELSQGPQALKIVLDKNWVQKSGYPSALKNKDMNRWYKKLLAGGTLNVIAAAKILDDGDSDIQFISSPEQFVSLWMGQGYVPVVVQSGADALDGQIQSLSRLAQKVRAEAQALQKQVGDEGDVKVMLEKVTAKTYLVENMYLIDNLFNYEMNASEQWTSLYSLDWDNANQLDTDMRQLVEQLRQKTMSAEK